MIETAGATFRDAERGGTGIIACHGAEWALIGKLMAIPPRTRPGHPRAIQALETGASKGAVVTASWAVTPTLP
jgi:hypothetical protein